MENSHYNIDTESRDNLEMENGQCMDVALRDAAVIDDGHHDTDTVSRDVPVNENNHHNVEIEPRGKLVIDNNLWNIGIVPCDRSVMVNDHHDTAPRDDEVMENSCYHDANTAPRDNETAPCDTAVIGGGHHDADTDPRDIAPCDVCHLTPKSVIVSISSKVRGGGGLATAISSVDNLLHCGLIVADDENTGNYANSTYVYHSDCLSVHIPEKLHHDYLNGFANSVLWPLFHYQTISLDILADIPQLYKAFKAVNARVATALSDHFGKEGNADIEPIFWIHDYQFFLLPFYLKRLFPVSKVGWFLHIPFPAYEMFRTLYKGEEILEKLLFADLIAFHTNDYANHFKDTLMQTFSVDDSVSTYARNPIMLNGVIENKIMVCPIGIDSNRFKGTVCERRNSGRKVFRFLGVDRRDTIKGIPHKLVVFRKFLAENPELGEQLELYQILVPTRQKVKAVNKMFRKTLALVDEINQEYGTENHTPVTLINDSVPFDVLVDLYRSSDAMLITSLRDGLNLVSFEYLASQDEKRPGVLLLSKYTGAYGLLKDGVLEMDPYDISFSVSQLNKAVAMGKAEKLKLFNKVKSFGEGNKSKEWAEAFIGKLKVV